MNKMDSEKDEDVVYGTFAMSRMGEEMNNRMIVVVKQEP